MAKGRRAGVRAGRLADALERLCQNKGGVDDLDVIASVLNSVADGARCNLASQQQVVVGAIMRRYGDEFAARLAPGSEPVAPLFVSEIRELDDGEVTLDERRRTKQPDWTYAAHWTGDTPVDLVTDHRRHP